jgi:hypothetical protein
MELRIQSDYNRKYEEKTFDVKSNRQMFDQQYVLHKRQRSLKGINLQQKMYLGRSELSSILLQKYSFALQCQNFTSMAVMFVGYFAFLYENDHTSNEDTYYFISTVLTFLTLIYTAARLFILNVQKLHLLSKHKFFTMDEWAKERIYTIFWIFVFMIHPNILFYRKRWISESAFSFNEPFYFTFRRNFNEYLFLVQFNIHAFKILSNFFQASTYGNDSTERVAQMYGVDRSDHFIAKCFIKEGRIRYFVIMLVYFLAYGSFMIRIVESPLALLSLSSIRDLMTSVWLSIVTIFTIGYGDMYPMSYFGRLILIGISLGAAILISFVTNQVLNRLRLSDPEQMSFGLNVHLRNHSKLRQASGTIIVLFRKSLNRMLEDPKKHHYYEDFKLAAAKKSFKLLLKEYNNDFGMQKVDAEKELLKLDDMVDEIVKIQKKL